MNIVVTVHGIAIYSRPVILHWTLSRLIRFPKEMDGAMDEMKWYNRVNVVSVIEDSF